MPVSTHPSIVAAKSLLLITVATLTACGGSSGDDSDNNSLKDVETVTIQRNAAAAIVRNLGLNTGEITSTFDPQLDDPNASGPDMMTPDNNLAIEESVGLNSNSATVSRVGNTDFCLQIAQNLSVTINAETEDSGVVSYLYRNEAFVNLSYTPNSGAYEIRFPPFLTVLQDQQATLLEEGTEPLPKALTGAIKFAVTSDPEMPDEAGSVALQISEPIQYTQSDNNSEVQIGVSTLWEISTNAEGGRFGFDLGAVSLSGNTADNDAPQRQDTKVLLPGLSGKAIISNASGDLIVSDLGLAQGPLSITTNSTEVISVALETFGFSISEANGQIVTNGDINLNAMLLPGWLVVVRFKLCCRQMMKLNQMKPALALMPDHASHQSIQPMRHRYRLPIFRLKARLAKMLLRDVF